jgi:signal transduction histidine kinase
LVMAAIDAQRLEQILYNLVHNAIRHTQPGGIVVLGVCIEGPIVLLQVKDTGEGIAAEELVRIWERFYQAHTHSSQLSSGSGLGLAIVKELTEAMGGTVAVESTLGEGSCFSLCFPLIPSYPMPMVNYV